MSKTSFQRRLSYTMQLTMSVSAAWFVWTEQWPATGMTLLGLAITLIPRLSRRLFGLHTPPPFLLSIVAFVFGSLFIGEAWGLYRFYWWWDVVLHLISGYLLGVVGFLLVYVLNGVPEVGHRTRPGFIAFFAFCFSMTFGVFWEFFEFLMDVSFTAGMQTEKAARESRFVDTMTDLLAAAGGALIVTLTGYYYLHQNKNEAFLMRWIDAFIHANPQLCRRSL